MSTSQFQYIIFLVATLATISCDVSISTIEPIEKEIVCEVINENYPGNSLLETAHHFHLDNDSLPDIRLLSVINLMPVGTSRFTRVKTLNNNWKLVGQHYHYFTCNDSIYGKNPECPDSIAVYNVNCNSTNWGAKKTNFNIPVSYQFYRKHSDITIDTNLLFLSHNATIHFQRPCSYWGTGYYFYKERINYCYYQNMTEFEILCRNKKGDLISILIDNLKPYNRSSFHIVETVCRN